MEITTKHYPDCLAEISLGEYRNDKIYRCGSVVTYNGFYYTAIRNCWNSPPSPGGGDSWVVMKDLDGKPVRKVEAA